MTTTSPVPPNDVLRVLAFEATTTGVVVTDPAQPDHPIVEANLAFERMTGYARDEAIGRNCRFLQGPGTDPAAVARIRQAVAAGREVTETLLNYRRDGTPFRNELRVTPVHDADGRLTHFVGVQTDVTARVEAEAALAAERDLLETVLAHLPDAVYVKDADGRFVRVNPVAAALYGLADPAAAVGLTDFDVFPADQAEEYQATERTLLAAGEPTTELEHHPGPAGGDRWLLATKVPLRGPDGAARGLVGISRDVTPLKRAEAAADAANRAKSRFLAMVSHDVRTPLTGVVGYADLLRDGSLGELTPDQVDAAERIVSGADRLLGLLNQVLDLSRIESEGLELVPWPVDLRALLDAVRWEFAAAAAAKGIAIGVEMPAALPPLVADGGRLRQVLANLVGNAVRFTAAGTVTLSARASGGVVEIAVADTGVGIAPKDLPRLFAEFAQVGDRAGEAGSSGLGLAIAKRLVELHGGTIRVESEPGVGSTFIVALPAVGGDRGAPPEAAGAAAAQDPRTGGDVDG